MPVSKPTIKPTLILAGPTASGKSALALQLAERLGGAIINADSMQVYQGLAILTAQPTAAEQSAVPHRLYGDRDPALPSSVADWCAAAQAAITDAYASGQRPIVVGGTGLYLKALLTGLSPIPAIPPDVRAATSAASTETLYQQLAAHDPAGAERLRPTDRQRLQRALEVVLATGQPLHHWQAENGTPLPFPTHRVVLLPERPILYDRINSRFLAMLAAGALAEVEQLLAHNLDPTLPAMKAVGVPELAAYLRGDCALDTAIQQAQQHSRNYAKRQYTWFRHQMAWDQVLISPDAIGDVIAALSAAARTSA
jgi:tRNA dimethylallyltransferase